MTQKTYTVIYNPRESDWDKMAWAQVTGVGDTYSEALESARKMADSLGNRHGFGSWKLLERIPRIFTKAYMARYRIS